MEWKSQPPPCMWTFFFARWTAVCAVHQSVKERRHATKQRQNKGTRPNQAKQKRSKTQHNQNNKNKHEAFAASQTSETAFHTEQVKPEQLRNMHTLHLSCYGLSSRVLFADYGESNLRWCGQGQPHEYECHARGFTCTEYTSKC